MNWLSDLFSWLKSLFSSAGVSDSTIAKIQAATVNVCGFLPMAESVANLVAAGNPAVMTVSTIANQICSVVTSSKSEIVRLEGTEMQIPKSWIVNGVEVHGEFVK